MPEDTIALVPDGPTRSALLALQARMQRLVEQVETQISNLTTRLDVYLATSAQDRLHEAETRTITARSNERNHEMLIRVFEKFQESFEKHCDADRKYQEDVGKENKEYREKAVADTALFRAQIAATFGSGQKWLIATLITLLLTSLTGIGTLVLFILNHR